MKISIVSGVFVVISSAVAASTAHAQFSLANVPPAFFVSPTSGVGTIVGNTLTLTANPNGFTVSGQLQISVPAGSFSGVLAQWTVIRRIDPFFASANLFTTGSIVGFSLPPAGTFGASSGSLTTDVRFLAGSAGFVGGSQNIVGLSLVNGVDSPSWGGPGLSATSGLFTHNTNFFPGSVLQQTFVINANQTSGAGGIWTIDVPVSAFLDVPAPGTGAVVLAGVFGIARRRRAGK